MEAFLQFIVPILIFFLRPLDSLKTLDSGDEDDMYVPNLLGYDFHAIYKQDGLQFDEGWQVRQNFQ